MAGPNDFHGEVINGVWTAMPGLGEFEPPPTTTPEQIARLSEIEVREAAMRVREQELAEREAAIEAASSKKKKAE